MRPTPDTVMSTFPFWDEPQRNKTTDRGFLTKQVTKYGHFLRQSRPRGQD